MSRRSPNYHWRQLFAALATFTALSAFSSYATIQTDGPKAHAWIGPMASGWLLTLFAAVWFAIVYTLAAVEAVRHARRSWRPTPRARRGAACEQPSLPEPAGRSTWATEQRNHNAADHWRADEPADVPPVDPAAATRPRPETGRSSLAEFFLDDTAWRVSTASESTTEPEPATAP